MSDTLTVFQIATILGISMQEVSRLIRARRLPVHHTERKVKHIAVEAIQAFITSQKVAQS